MYLIVNDSYELSGHAPTDAEKLLRAETWSRALFGVIPEDALEKSFQRAFRDHTGSFAISAYELKDAYEKIKNEHVALGQSRQLTTDERVERCANKLNHLPGAYGAIKLCIPDVVDDAVVPCGRCQPEEFRAKKRELLAGREEPKFGQSLDIARALRKVA
jgi:hypothetical protein